MTLANLVEAMGDAATVDLRGQEVLPRALDLLESASLTADQGSAVTLLRDWIDNQAQRRDRDANGDYDDEAAVALMDAWYPRMIETLLPQLTAVEDDDSQGFVLMERDNQPGEMGSAYQKGYYGSCHQPGPSAGRPGRPRQPKQLERGRTSRRHPTPRHRPFQRARHSLAEPPHLPAGGGIHQPPLTGPPFTASGSNIDLRRATIDVGPLLRRATGQRHALDDLRCQWLHR